MYSRVLRQLKYNLRIEKLAKEKGYETVERMFYELYTVQGMSLETLAATLLIPMWSLRKRFEELGITKRSRGGQNHIFLHITPELVDEVTRDGITATAERLGILPTVLNARMREWYEKTGGKFDDTSTNID